MEQLNANATQQTDETTVEYVGQWNRLVSTTNWEKGRIISQWREQLLAAGVPANQCTDEAWAQQVGNVSPQHVGRLRRVYQRFGRVTEQFPGLYWSHFQAAVDWHDAEMWLEGAVQNQWSISQMRQERWTASGSLPEEQPLGETPPAAEFDEDVDPANDDGPQMTLATSTEAVYEPGVGEEMENEVAAERASAAGDEEPPFDSHASTAESAAPVRPFEDMPPLPPDLLEAFERFKLAILHHKVAGWEEVSREHVLAALSALERMVLAPSEVAKG